MEQEAEVFGNRTISGFLAQVGAEEAMSADQVIWSEQGRLHLSYKDVAVGGSGNAGTLTFDAGALDADGKSVTSTTAAIAHGIRKGDMLLISQSGVTKRAYVTNVASGSGTANGVVTFERYDGENYDEGTMADGHAAVLVFGSEYAKGVQGREGANKPQHLSRTNKPIILKDKYEISGSDASQIGWVEVSGEDGQSGYMWYLKAAGDTKSRFADYLEMAMLEAVDNSSNDTAGHQGGTITGTEGLCKRCYRRKHVIHG
jgi:hypothetical protein